MLVHGRRRPHRSKGSGGGLLPCPVPVAFPWPRTMVAIDPGASAGQRATQAREALAMGQMLAALAVMGACVAIHLFGGFALIMRMHKRLEMAHERSLMYGCAIMFKL